MLTSSHFLVNRSTPVRNYQPEIRRANRQAKRTHSQAHFQRDINRSVQRSTSVRTHSLRKIPISYQSAALETHQPRRVTATPTRNNSSLFFNNTTYQPIRQVHNFYSPVKSYQNQVVGQARSNLGQRISNTTKINTGLVRAPQYSLLRAGRNRTSYASPTKSNLRKSQTQPSSPSISFPSNKQNVFQQSPKQSYQRNPEVIVNKSKLSLSTVIKPKRVESQEILYKINNKGEAVVKKPKISSLVLKGELSKKKDDKEQKSEKNYFKEKIVKEEANLIDEKEETQKQDQNSFSNAEASTRLSKSPVKANHDILTFDSPISLQKINSSQSGEKLSLKLNEDFENFMKRAKNKPITKLAQSSLIHNSKKLEQYPISLHSERSDHFSRKSLNSSGQLVELGKNPAPFELTERGIIEFEKVIDEEDVLNKKKSQKNVFSLEKETKKNSKKEIGQMSFKLKTALRSVKGYCRSGSKVYNQDAVFSQEYKKLNAHVLGVCDGHGQYGHLASQFVAQKLPKLIKRAILTWNKVSDFGESIFVAVKELIKLIKESGINLSESGTTCSFYVLLEGKIYAVNIGDSRGIISMLDNNRLATQQLTLDHKPDNPQEKARIEASLGRIDRAIGEDGIKGGPNRIYLKDDHTGGLAVSRSIGDFRLAPAGLVWYPDVTVCEIKENLRMLFLATDGIWDKAENNEVASIFDKYYDSGDVEKASDEVLKIVRDRWMRKMASDDIGFVAVFLRF